MKIILALRFSYCEVSFAFVALAGSVVSPIPQLERPLCPISSGSGVNRSIRKVVSSS